VIVPPEVSRTAWSLTRTGFDSAEIVLEDGTRVALLDRGVFPDDGGRVVWIRVYGAPSPRYARNVAERFGRVTEADVSEDGAASFSVVQEEPAA
jgi:hypothetical protein